MDHLERFLELVRRELGGEDAHFELGGHPPTDPKLLWAAIADGWRVVARLPEPDPPAAKRDKLEALVASFSSLEGQLQRRLPRTNRAVAAAEVDDALGLLAASGQALRAVVIDEDSPMLWGSSEAPRGPEDVEALQWIGELADSAAGAGLDTDALVELTRLDDAGQRERLASLEPRKLRERLLRKLPLVRELGAQRSDEGWPAHLATCRAVAAVRRAPERHEAAGGGLGWFARDFAGIYHVILVYLGPFSEIAATRAMNNALSAIERLVLALPPIDPTPKGARVLAFPPRG